MSRNMFWVIVYLCTINLIMVISSWPVETAESKPAVLGSYGNLMIYTDHGIYRGDDERVVPDGVYIDSVLVVSTGTMFCMPGSMQAEVAKNRSFTWKEYWARNGDGWSMWSNLIPSKTYHALYPDPRD